MNIQFNLPKFLIISFFVLINVQTFAQNKVVWANKLLEYVDKFQYENNFAELVLGPPTIYPSIEMNEKRDPYSEGYILNFEKTSKRNEFKVGFSKPILANQIIIGGIFNIGTIEEIYIENKEGKEKLVYKLDKPASKVKFRSFATFIPENTVVAVRVVINHSKINEWNIIKGIGLYYSKDLYTIAPDLIEDTTHKHKKELVSTNINSDDCFEFAPKIAPDGKTLYFVRECKGQDDQDIWYSELDSLGNWSDAKNIGIPLNNKGHNFVASISPDGTTLILGNRYKEDGTDDGEGVSISTKQPDGKWSIPKAIDIPDYKNINEHANFFMNENKDALIMAIQNEKSYGDLDLYVSLYDKITKKWSAPKNLGPGINTAFSEDYPYLAIDGKTLYFSSKGYTGYGSHDIYVAERLDDTWTNWSKPKNLGPFVNTKGDDKGFVIASHGDYAYFNSTSFDAEFHNMDIFKVDLPKILHQEKRILLSGTLYNVKDKSPLRGTVSAKKEGKDVVAFGSSNPKTGHYIISVPHGYEYEVLAEVIDFDKVSKKLDLKDTSIGLEVSLNFEFGDISKEPLLAQNQKLSSDKELVSKILEKILFEYNSANLSQESKTVLDNIVKALKTNPKAKISIEAHTDHIGSAAYNQKLSERRAKSVVDYLVSKGINKNRISYKGFGESQPIADNSTEEGRAQNRRVEMKVKK